MKIEKTIWPIATLCFPIKNDQILMSRKVVEKNVHKPGAGKLNGYGGGQENGESLGKCSVRELFEECGLIAEERDLELVAIIYFHNTKSDGQTFICKVYVYFVKKWKGLPRDGDKMKDPKWYQKLALPLDDMTLGDRDWLPPVLLGSKIISHVYYGPFQRELLKPTEIKEVQFFSDDD